MKFACPGCSAEMSASPPKPGRFTLKCPHCGGGMAVRVSVMTLADEKAQLQRGMSLASFATNGATDPDRTAAPSAPQFSDPGTTDPDATAAPRGQPADFDQTSAVRSSNPDETEATRGAAPRTDQGDDTFVTSTKASAGDDADDPESFPGYEVLKRLGKGGMGSVFLARQVSLDRSVALKTLNPEWASDPAFISRFVREAYAAAQLTHHNVVQIYELGRDGPVNFFSMEYVHGGSLGDRLKKTGKLPPDEAVGYVIQAASGLRFAHDRGMVHRDIKPDNLMVNDEGLVKVADLGLVKTKGVSAEEDAGGGGNRTGDGSGLGSLPDVTRAGSAMGSPSYMAPEQCRDATTVDGRADIYSLGCTLYAVLVGKTPYQGKTAAEVISKHLYEPPPSLARTAPDVPRDLARIVERSLAKDPAERFQSMAEFIAALKQWQEAHGKSVGKPTEEQLAVFEGLTKQVANEPKAGWAGRVAMFGPLLGLLVGLIAVFLHPLTGGVILLGTLAAVASGFATGGLLTGSHLFRKAREWAFGARIVDWLTVGLAAVLFVVGLYVSGLILFGVVGLVLGAAVGIGYGYGLAKPAAARAAEMKDDLESLAKRWRLAGMDEDEVRKFVAENAGDRWERVYELVYGYPAKLLARTQHGAKVANRPKYAGWRDALVARLEAMIQQRKDAKAKKLLQQTEAARLKAAGMSDVEAKALAEDAAEDVVEQGRAIQAANADRKKTVNVREMMSRYEKAKAIPRRPRTPTLVRVFKKVLGLPFDPRFRLLLGAVLVVGALFWVNQNTAGAVEQLKNVPGEQAGAAAGSLWGQVVPLALNPEKGKPLSVGWLPQEVIGWFDSLNPLVAGLLVLLSAQSSRTRTVLVVVLAAAVAFAGQHLLGLFGVTLPDLGPLKVSHVTGLVGLLVGVGGFVVLGRK
jgi:serine/threonine protein kinase